MGTYEILMLLLMFVLALIVADSTYRQRPRTFNPQSIVDNYWEGRHEGFQEGYAMAKEVYAQPYVAPEIPENTYTPMLTSEVLMAFGVDYASQLPREVLKQYGTTPEDVQGMSVDSMLKQEVGLDEI